MSGKQRWASAYMEALGLWVALGLGAVALLGALLHLPFSVMFVLVALTGLLMAAGAVAAWRGP